MKIECSKRKNELEIESIMKKVCEECHFLI
jgi:hypothetical protein